MPNWCNNTISISGPTETIKQLWDDAHIETTNEDGEVVKDFALLDAMHPMPKELEGTEGLGEGANWYRWRVNNWGTKWEISDEGLEFIDNEDGTAMIEGWFDSAWAPPTGAYDHFLDMMDNCSVYATYHEPGMDFAGIYNDGEDNMMSDLYDEYKKPLDEQSDLFRELDDEFGLSEQFEMYEDDEE